MLPCTLQCTGGAPQPPSPSVHGATTEEMLPLGTNSALLSQTVGREDGISRAGGRAFGISQGLFWVEFQRPSYARVIFVARPSVSVFEQDGSRLRMLILHCPTS